MLLVVGCLCNIKSMMTMLLAPCGVLTSSTHSTTFCSSECFRYGSLADVYITEIFI